MTPVAGDARTLLTTLRSAVSALMDFANPLERLALNQEYVALARAAYKYGIPLWEGTVCDQYADSSLLEGEAVKADV